MIVYKVFNPLMGVHEEFPNMQEAEIRKEAICKEYLKHHTPKSVQVEGSYIFNRSFREDYVIAYNFMQKKLGDSNLYVLDDKTCLPMTNLFGYRHSIFNITENKLWARTFSYEHAGSIWHIKVKDKQVIDWYKNTASYYDWMSFDLDTNLPLEQYEKYSENVMVKKNLVYKDVNPVYTNFVADNNPLPKNILAVIPDTINPLLVFAWASKDYGDIIEFDENSNIYVNESDYPQWAIDENKKLLQKEIEKVIEEAKNIYIAEVEIIQEGSEIWR